MDSDLAGRAKTLFRALTKLKDDRERVTFLERECSGQPELKKAVIDLWVSDDPLSLQRESLNSAALQPSHPDAAAGVAVQPWRPQPSQLPAAQAPQVGSMLAGKYRLLEVIGEGGMGLVFRAEQITPPKRTVAVKLVKADTTFQFALERFRIEQQALAAMKHPNIAQMLDAGTAENGSPFYVMEYFHGKIITQFCDLHQLDAQRRLLLFLDVCQAISHAHETGLVHRDIKPANILVTQDGDQIVPKVIDFGLVKVNATSTSADKKNLTRLGMVLGTLEYMSPEQAQAHNDLVDARSDVYALGVLLFELLTGTTPVKKRTFVKQGTQEFLRKRGVGYIPRPSFKLSTSTYLAKIAADRAIAPQKLITILQENLDAIILKALEKDPNRRHQSAKQLALEIQDYLDGKIAKRPFGGWRNLWPGKEKTAARVVIASIFLLLPMMLIALAVLILRALSQE